MTSKDQRPSQPTPPGPTSEESTSGRDTLLQFVTSTGSTYQVDLRHQEIRRLTGIHAPTQRQGDDGAWQHYLAITPVTLAAPVLIIWRHTPDGISQTSITSPVVHIEPVPR